MVFFLTLDNLTNWINYFLCVSGNWNKNVFSDMNDLFTVSYHWGQDSSSLTLDIYNIEPLSYFPYFTFVRGEKINIYGGALLFSLIIEGFCSD